MATENLLPFALGIVGLVGSLASIMSLVITLKNPGRTSPGDDQNSDFEH